MPGLAIQKILYIQIVFRFNYYKVWYLLFGPFSESIISLVRKQYPDSAIDTTRSPLQCVVCRTSSNFRAPIALKMITVITCQSIWIYMAHRLSLSTIRISGQSIGPREIGKLEQEWPTSSRVATELFRCDITIHKNSGTSPLSKTNNIFDR